MAERRRQLDPGADRDPALRALQTGAFLVGTGIGLALSLAFAAGVLAHPERATPAGAGERINPNEAPVASLMRLPQIGAARARAIVAERDRAALPPERRPVFRKADDLQRIKGIGPAIVEAVRPWLQFDNPPPDANKPRDG